MSNKILLAMSGGIDSSAAAVILKEQGADVTGYTFYIEGVTTDAVKNASKICKKLGIRHIYEDITEEFNKEVIEYFKNEYEKGRTPNPCIRCNREIKFGLIYDYMLKNNFDKTATGHFASIIEKNNRKYLALSVDPTRDQTYFLYVLKEEQLSHIVFPLNGIKKSRAREICEKADLMPADAKESREICFVPNNYKNYLENKLKATSKQGNFIDVKGNIIAPHKGIKNYTVGQRKGLGIALGSPYYITKINAFTGDITLGNEADLFTDEITINDINLINGQIPTKSNLYVKIRYGSSPVRIRTIEIKDDFIFMRTNEKVRAVTPGQSAVIYNDNIVVGGGIIK